MKRSLIILALLLFAFSCSKSDDDPETVINPTSQDTPDPDSGESPDDDGNPETPDESFDLIFGVFPDSEAEWVFLTDEEAVIGADSNFNGIIDGVYIDSQEGDFYIEIDESVDLPRSVAFSSGGQAFFNYNEDFTTATITLVNSDGTAEVIEDVPVSSNSDSSKNSQTAKQIGDLYSSEDSTEDTNSNSVEYGKGAISTAASIAGCMLAPYANTVSSRNVALLSCSVFLMKWFISTEEAKNKEGETPNASPNTLYTITDGVSGLLNDAGCVQEIAEIVRNRRGIPISCTDRLLGTSYGEDGVENLAKWADELANSDFNKPSVTVLIDGNNTFLGDTDFGEVQVGAELSKKVEITNNSPYDIINLSSFLSSSTDFILDVTNTSNSLNPFESTSFFITFRPQSPGNKNSTITINTDVVGSIGLTVSGIGKGNPEQEFREWLLNNSFTKQVMFDQPCTVTQITQNNGESPRTSTSDSCPGRQGDRFGITFNEDGTWSGALLLDNVLAQPNVTRSSQVSSYSIEGRNIKIEAAISFDQVNPSGNSVITASTAYSFTWTGTWGQNDDFLILDASETSNSTSNIVTTLPDGSTTSSGGTTTRTYNFKYLMMPN
jgi:hypothetical protein